MSDRRRRAARCPPERGCARGGDEGCAWIGRLAAGPGGGGGRHGRRGSTTGGIRASCRSAWTRSPPRIFCRRHLAPWARPRRPRGPRRPLWCRRHHPRPRRLEARRGNPLGSVSAAVPRRRGRRPRLPRGPRARNLPRTTCPSPLPRRQPRKRRTRPRPGLAIFGATSGTRLLARVPSSSHSARGTSPSRSSRCSCGRFRCSSSPRAPRTCDSRSSFPARCSRRARTQPPSAEPACDAALGRRSTSPYPCAAPLWSSGHSGPQSAGTYSPRTSARFSARCTTMRRVIRNGRLRDWFGRSSAHPSRLCFRIFRTSRSRRVRSHRCTGACCGRRWRVRARVTTPSWREDSETSQRT